MSKDLEEKTFLLPTGIFDPFYKMFSDIAHVEGQVVKVRNYGGSVFVTFENGKTYEISMQLYDPCEITEDTK